MKMKIQELVMDGIQTRIKLNEAKARNYAKLMKEDGAEFPKVIVFFDGINYYLADGYHRVKAHQINKIEEIDVDLREGTKRDAIIYNIEANGKSGLNMSQADKVNAIYKLLTDPECAGLSCREIARICGVHHSTVSKYQKAVENGIDPRTTKVDKDGNPQKTNSNGKKGATQKEEKIDTEKEEMKAEIERLRKENKELKAKIKKLELEDTGTTEFNKRVKTKLIKLTHTDGNQGLTKEEILLKMEEATKILNSIKV